LPGKTQEKPGAPENEDYQRLVELLAEVTALQQSGGVLFWDQQTYMPKAGAKARGNHLAALSKVSHEKFTAPEIGQLLEKLREWEESLPYDSDEASTIRVARREYEKATRLPPDLVVRHSRARVRAHEAWIEARQKNDYSVFHPALGEMVDIMREVADTLGYEEHPLDALLDQQEPGMKTADMEKLFDELRQGLVPLVKAIAEKAGAVDDSLLHQPFDRETQVEVCRDAVAAIGFDLETRGRIDFSVHPFTMRPGTAPTSRVFRRGSSSPSSPTAPPPACTSRSRASGRISSAGRVPSGSSTTPGSGSASPSSSGRPPRKTSTGP